MQRTYTTQRTPLSSAIPTGLQEYANMRLARRVFYHAKKKTRPFLHASALLAAGRWCSWRSLNYPVITRVTTITRNYPPITQPQFRCCVIRRLYTQFERPRSPNNETRAR